MPLPAAGSAAPEFTLPSTSGSDVTLSGLRGKNVLLAFFPLAFTRTCTAEVCAFGEDCGQFQAANTVVLPISVDSVATLKAFKEHEHVKVDMLSDFKRGVSRAYGVLNEEKFHADRSYVLIDRAGVVRWTLREEHNGLRREDDELLAEIRKLG